MAEIATNAVDDIDKPAKDEAALAKSWCAEIAAAEKQQSKWVERAKKIEKIYADDRDTRQDRARKFNILWSNVETLRPAVYMQTPKAKAVRRYRDRDPVARFGAMMIERAVQTSCELYDFDHAMDQAVRDRLVVGRGQAWVFYKPTEEGQGDSAMLAYEDVMADYLPWTDFLHAVARTWGEVWWVGRWFHKSRRELREWLDQRGLDSAMAYKVSMDVSPEGDKTEEGLKDERARARICEVWNRRDGEVLYVAPGSGENAILGRVEPPVKFRDFFPCPRPMLATTTSRSLIPTPDYALYQDQAEELNRLTARIDVLQKALKVVGVYASDSEELAQMLESGDNRMIAVKNWAMFAEGGGAKNKIEWFPVEQVIVVLQQLYEVRERAKQTLYEVSGIGDILRGASDPNETLGAQRIKEQWGGKRVRRLQKDVQRFAADIMRLKAEVITEQFQFANMAAMAGVDQELLSKYITAPPPPQLPPEIAQQPQAQQLMAQQQQMALAQATKQFLAEVEKLLKDDTARNFRIDVETDSTLEPDVQAEKQLAVEFAAAMGAFLKEAQPIVALGPEAAKMIGEILLFTVRRFGHSVDQLEKTIEEAIEAASKPRQAPPDPDMIKAQADVERGKAELALKQQEAQAKLGESSTKAELEREKLKLEGSLGKIDAMLKAKELQIKARELDLKDREIGTRAALDRDKLDDAKAAREADDEHREKDRSSAERLARRKAGGPDEAEDMDAEDAGQPTRTDRLIEAIVRGNEALVGTLVAEMRRPKKVIRGSDGRPEGVA